MATLFPWGLVLLAAAGAMPATTKPATVTIDGQRLPVRRALFGISIVGETWDAKAKRYTYGVETASVRYWLRVEVDDHSGEDGAPLPEVENIPVPRQTGGKHPSLAALGKLTVRELDDGYDCEDWDAWFGNDAPGLCGNVVRFQGWQDGALRVRWEAIYQEEGQDKPLLFEGGAEFTGIFVKVAQAEDVDRFLSRAWGGQPVDTLDRHLLGVQDNGPEWPEDRRWQASYVYMPKGVPLTYWTKAGSATTVLPSPTSRPQP